MSFQRKLLVPLLCALVLSCPVGAAQVDAGESYQFCSADFSGENRTLCGVCITELPKQRSGKVLLGQRGIRAGDILTVAQLDEMVFAPCLSESDTTAAVKYLPVFSDGLGEEASMVLSVRGREDKPPVAEDFAVETYKNLPAEGLLKVSDPEEQELTYTVVRKPRRGEIFLRPDGSYLYSPAKNKVGTDSFTFTASDPAGNVSREATVTIQILKTSAEQPYSDTVGSDCRFSAEWLRNRGIFTGETVGGQSCFSPDEPVTRGQFLAMLMQTLKLPVEQHAQVTGFSDDAPEWLRPYLAAGLRSGLITGYPGPDGIEFRPDQPIRSQEAAVMVQGAMNFAIPTGLTDDDSIAAWAKDAVSAVSGSGVSLPEGDILTRSDAAQILYRINGLNDKEALISAVFRQ